MGSVKITTGLLGASLEQNARPRWVCVLGPLTIPLR